MGKKKGILLLATMITLLFLTLIPTMAQAAGETIAVENVPAGGLAKAVEETSDFSSHDAIQSLTIEGTLDYDDFYYIKTELSGLETLNLSGISNTSLPDEALRNYGFLNNLERVILSDQTTLLSNSAFRDCVSLTTVDLSHVETIGDSVFLDCAALTDVDLSAVTSIGGYAFGGCAALTLKTGTNLNTNLTNISAYAFYNCTALTDVDLSAVRSIKPFAFAGCTSLNTLALPAITSIQLSAFEGCTSLNTLALPAVKPTIVSSAFLGAPSMLLLVAGGTPYDDFSEFPTGSAYPSIFDNTNLAEGDALSLSVVPIRTSPVSYQWSKESLLPGETGSTLSKADVTSADAGTYTCAVTLGSVTVNVSATVSVTPAAAQAPVIDTQPVGADAVTLGDIFTLSVVASSPDDGALTYQWYSSANPTSDFAQINGATNSSYNVPTNQAGTTYYYVEITNTKSSSSAQIDSSVIEVTVIASAATIQYPVIKTQPMGCKVLLCTPYALTVKAVSPDGGVLLYQWYVSDSGKDGTFTKIPNATHSTYIVPTVHTGGKYYQVVVTNTLSQQAVSVTSNTAKVEVITILMLDCPIVSVPIKPTPIINPCPIIKPAPVPNPCPVIKPAPIIKQEPAPAMPEPIWVTPAAKVASTLNSVVNSVVSAISSLFSFVSGR